MKRQKNRRLGNFVELTVVPYCVGSYPLAEADHVKPRKRLFAVKAIMQVIDTRGDPYFCDDGPKAIPAIAVQEGFGPGKETQGLYFVHGTTYKRLSELISQEE